MYNDLKKMYWWSGMKRDVSKFVSKCLIFQQVKAEHQVPSGLLLPVMVSEWKWDRITMDFVSGLSLMPKKKDVILEDMLRCCVLEFQGSWERYLLLVDFAYNNSYQSSLKMSPYEALYGRKC
ncbi:DNA/RNA polymerases superfamily protein [Gossypium australe]|uniref:DNA/RNA polymerases superfamily protein n=1 Tax=Gossypium australe TaxID=47621 RepID=A0A5B6WGX9_9ROSI|nr:DNA/RNA polymerases superfamily protein [Gossypium australe]